MVSKTLLRTRYNYLLGLCRHTYYFKSAKDLICLLQQKMSLLWPFYTDGRAPAFTMPFSVLILEIIRPDVSCPLGPLGGQEKGQDAWVPLPSGRQGERE